ncbi:MAG: hypothetical protein MZV64_14870 [Ignavibacteriales bacterium]|nr:hypothetical protein [Ignavibacteriales bacterium]
MGAAESHPHAYSPRQGRPRVHPSQSLELYRSLKMHGKAPVRLICNGVRDTATAAIPRVSITSCERWTGSISTCRATARACPRPTPNIRSTDRDPFRRLPAGGWKTRLSLQRDSLVHLLEGVHVRWGAAVCAAAVHSCRRRCIYGRRMLRIL